jgi:cellulose biosynthesis protein BcsQ
MPIISLVNTKGGCAKSTLAQCISHSQAFRKAFKRIALVELDIQGTLASWAAAGPDKPIVNFHQVLGTDKKAVGSELSNIVSEHDVVVLDCPGQSQGGFMTQVAINMSDLILIPMRSSTFDENAFAGHLMPLLDGHPAYVLPTFVHPSANQTNIKKYFDYILPQGIGCLKACFTTRSIYENFNREGATMTEYLNIVKRNQRERKTVENAIQDVETIAKEILKYVTA